MSIDRIDAFRTDLDGTDRKEMPNVTVEEVSWVLNQPGGAKLSVDPLHPEALLMPLNESEVQIWFNDNIQHYVVPRGLSGGLERVSFDCEGVLSWFHYAHFTSGVINNFSEEQFNLAANLVEYAQTGANSNRNIDVGLYVASGIPRARPTLADDFPNIYDLLQEFPKLYQGFDFDIELFNDGRREFMPYYPSKGTRKPQYALELDQRGRKFVRGLEGFKKDGFNMATDVYNSGGTVTIDEPDPTPDTQLKIVGHYEDLTANGSPKYGRMTKVMSDGQIIDLGWLNDRAHEEEILRGQPITVADIVVTEDLLGLIDTGDVLPARIDYGAIQMMGDYRIMSITWRNSSRDLKLGLQPA